MVLFGIVLIVVLMVLSVVGIVLYLKEMNKYIINGWSLFWKGALAIVPMLLVCWLW